MFIYEKNKLNKKTGVVEQSLNVTFEGNKPVETPDVVITKDGVTGIKSDSKTYMIVTPHGSDRVSSYSIDGEIQTLNLDSSYNTISMLFTKSAGINISNSTLFSYMHYITKNNNSVSYKELRTKADDPLSVSDLGNGEYIFDYENKIFHTPTHDYNFSELSNDFNSSIDDGTFAGISFDA